MSNPHHRAPWTAWLAAVLALLLVIDAVDKTVAPIPGGDGVGFQLDLEDDTGNRLTTADLLDKEDAAAIFGKLPDDPEGFRSALNEARWRINLSLGGQVAEHRTAWAGPMARAINWLSLGFLLLLLGPALVFLRGRKARRDQTESKLARALHSTPYFVVSAGATMMVLRGLSRLIIDVSTIQIGLGSMGSLSPSLSDATLHLIVHDNSAATDTLLQQLSQLDSFSLFEGFWRLCGDVYDSGLLRVANPLFDGLTWLVDLYGPVLAVLTVMVMVRIVVPVLRNLLVYPANVARGVLVETPGRFLWVQLKRLWAEVRVAFWSILFIVLIEAMAVLLVRALSFPIAWMALEALSTALSQVALGGDLPDLGLFFTLLSLALTLGGVAVFCLASAATLLSRAQVMLRARQSEKRGFREFPAFWRLVASVVRQVVGPTLLVFTGGVLAYAALTFVFGGNTRVWAPVAVAPIVLGGIVWLRLPTKLWALTKVDVLARPGASGSGRDLSTSRSRRAGSI